GIEQFAAPLLGIHARNRGVTRIKSDEMANIGHNRFQIRAQRDDFTFKLDADRLFVVCVIDSEASADGVDQRVKRDRLTEGKATALLPSGPVTDALPELMQETGFADAGFADDEDHLSVSGSGLLEAVRKDGELFVTTEERSQATLGFYVETASCRLSGEDFPG